MSIGIIAKSDKAGHSQYQAQDAGPEEDFDDADAFTGCHDRGDEDDESAAAEGQPIRRQFFRVPSSQENEAQAGYADEGYDGRTKAVQDAANRSDVAVLQKDAG